MVDGIAEQHIRLRTTNNNIVIELQVMRVYQQGNQKLQKLNCKKYISDHFLMRKFIFVNVDMG